MKKCIECGNKEFRKGIIEICTKCEESYSDEEASSVIAGIVDECVEVEKKRTLKLLDEIHTTNKVGLAILKELKTRIEGK